MCATGAFAIDGRVSSKDVLFINELQDTFFSEQMNDMCVWKFEICQIVK